ncbi:MAG: hypothetical protein P4L42_15565 [Desulfocapsaceae bacterium]|nr:hypothetical protein [Desulfocapsaceae bacterium]
MRQRKAIKRVTEIVAECPVNGVCALKLQGIKPWQRCGYFDGTVRDHRGLRVVCKLEN